MKIRNFSSITTNEFTWLFLYFREQKQKQIQRKNPKIITTSEIDAIVYFETPASDLTSGVIITGLIKELGVVGIDFLKVKQDSKNKEKISNDKNDEQ